MLFRYFSDAFPMSFRYFSDAFPMFFRRFSDALAVDVLRCYAMRWLLEVALHNAKGYLGFKEPQGWTRRAVERTDPIAILLYTLIVLWFARWGHKHLSISNRSVVLTQNRGVLCGHTDNLTPRVSPRNLSAKAAMGQAVHKNRAA